ncbi:MAG: NusG domain II-containing protein [Eubacteriales bacterium]|nr:NusG domain II-containing protein [Eubacteriales bacterium]
MEKVMKKRTLVFALLLLLLSAVSYAAVTIYQNQTTEKGIAVVIAEGVEIGRYPLNRDREEMLKYENGGYNILTIQHGEAQITEASCPDKICVYHRPISKNGQSIVCLPNELIIEIQNAPQAEIDAVTN